jgi:hypothetical protein
MHIFWMLVQLIPNPQWDHITVINTDNNVQYVERYSVTKEEEEKLNSLIEIEDNALNDSLFTNKGDVYSLFYLHLFYFH